MASPFMQEKVNSPFSKNILTPPCICGMIGMYLIPCSKEGIFLMNAKALKTLEYDKITARLAEYTHEQLRSEVLSSGQ